MRKKGPPDEKGHQPRDPHFAGATPETLALALRKSVKRKRQPTQGDTENGTGKIKPSI